MSLWSQIRDATDRLWPRRSKRRSELGRQGERLAERFLKRRGYRIVDRGYHNHIGEIDLIAIDQKSSPRAVVFVEVKTRQSDERGLPVESVNEAKQRQITETALVFLKQHGLLESRFRFDVIGILWPDGEAPEITHYPEAFEPVGRGQLFH